MRHDVVVEGHAFRLRPIADADAPFVLQLRTDPALNRYVHAVSGQLEDQLRWLASYYERPGDYYFVVERRDDGAAEGVVAVYDVDPATQTAEWGRWILRPGSLAAIESAWLTYRCALDVLKLSSVCCRTVANNASVVSFHDSCGIADRRLLPARFHLGGEALDAIEHRVAQADWPALSAKLEPLARMTARRAARHA